jgi:threonine aldolase
VWLENARSANARAKQLEAGIRKIGAAEILYPVEANSVFLKLPDSIDRKLREKGWVYYVFIGGGARLMCSWATTEADVRDFLRDLADATRGSN